MSSRTDPIIESLDAFVPPFEGAAGEWDAVLAEASQRSALGHSLFPNWRDRQRWRPAVPRSPRLLLAGAALLVLLGAGSALAATGWPPSKSGVTPPTQPPIPPRVSSIEVIHESPMPGMEFGVNNMWQGPVGGTWVLAYAGDYNETGGADTSVNAPYEPAIALWSEPVDPNAPNQAPQLIGVYPAPGSEASVQITAANGAVLTLTGIDPNGPDGQSFTFNTATHTYGK